ncbi:MAG TPA: DUF4388 domain-containing protein, partial [Polyangiales bacterium]|nr:DUF4388 domain-containing protein [Polyangiales bacterium]
MSRTVIKPQPGFRAELPGLDLPTLIQMTCARRERLVVRVSSYGEEGFLYSAEGRIVHASVGELIGDEAVLRMLAWPTGEFSICERPFPLRATVESSTEGLLLRAAQRSDEAALDRETDHVLREEAGLSEQLEGEEPSFRPYAPLPALSLPPRAGALPVRRPPPPPVTTRPMQTLPGSPALASLLQVRARDDDELPTMPTPEPRRADVTREAILPQPARTSSPPAARP